MPIWGPIIVGAAGAAIGQYFQQRTWDNQQTVAMRQSEVKIANELFQTMSTKVDTRYNTMDWVWWGFNTDVSKEDVATRWKAYQQVLLDWNQDQSKNSALTLLYFGAQTARFLDEHIQGTFDSMNLKLAALRYDDPPADEREQLVKTYREEAAGFRETIRGYNLMMVSALQRQEVGIFRSNADKKNPQMIARQAFAVEKARRSQSPES